MRSSTVYLAVALTAAIVAGDASWAEEPPWGGAGSLAGASSQDSRAGMAGGAYLHAGSRPDYRPAHWAGYGGWYGYRPGYWGGYYGYYGPRAGVYLGTPWYWGAPYPWYGYTYPYPYASPAWRYAPPIGYNYALPPADYVERPEQTAQTAPGGMWYYCVDPPGYYPHVSRCGRPWMAVAPFDVEGSAGKPRISP